MESFNHKKKIQGRDVDLFVIDKFRRKVKRFGERGCHITVPTKHFEREAEIKIITPKPFVCKDCIEIITREQHHSPEKDVCDKCYKTRQTLKEKSGKMKCKVCKKKISDEEFKQAWGREICEPCWIKEAEEINKEEDKK